MSLLELEQEVKQLKALVQSLCAMVDPAELAAARALQEITPTNATLKSWVAESVTPPELANEQETRPW